MPASKQARKETASKPVIQEVISARDAIETINHQVTFQPPTTDIRVQSDAISSEDNQPENPSEMEVAVPQAESISSLAQSEQKALRGEEKQLLLNLLHREINANKQYPYLAIRQRRQGRVSLNFMLHPDGHISDIAIIESSRFEMLDHAARSAVEKVSPFRLASNYLQQTELFNVDIEFRLN